MKTYEQLNEEQIVAEKDPFTPDRYRQFARHFPTKTTTVLDVGCSTGRGGKVLKELNHELQMVGLDCLESRLSKLPADAYDRTICSYTTNIDANEESFDVVVAGEFIEHIYPEEVVQTFREFYRVLKPGGRVLLTTPNPNYLKLKVTGGSVLGGAHVSEHYPEDLKKELGGIGFVNIKIMGSGKGSRILGEFFPVLSVYGSYLTIADKTALVQSN